MANTGRRRVKRRTGSDHDIDDPLRDDNDLLRALSVERLFYRIERQNGSLDRLFSRIAADRDIGAFFAIDLYRQRDGAFDQKLRLELRPGFGRDHRLMAECGPAFLGEMRHHWMKQPHQNIACLGQGPSELRRGGGLRSSDRVAERIGALIYMRDAAVETQLGDVLRNVGKGAVGGFTNG